MIFQLKNLQLFLNGSELASHRLEYYKAYGMIFGYPPEKLNHFLDIEENVEALTEDYLDLFIRPNVKHISPCGSAYNKPGRKKRNIIHFLATDKKNQRPDDHISICLDYMRFLIKREKRQWQIKNDLLAINILQQEQDYLVGHLNWLPALCAEIQNKTSSQFYNEVALNLKNFFQLEKLLLETILTDRLGTLN